MLITSRLVLNLIVTGSFLIFVSGCGGGSKKESAAEDVTFEESGKLAEDMKTFIADLPAPTEVPYMLQATGADFNPGIINDLSRLDNYLTNEDETALNLGIYATDIGYLVSYEKVDKALEYTEACQKLAEALGVASAFNVKTIERFQENMSNPDSLNAIFSESIVGVEERLQSSDRVNSAALILSGSFIEGLYLATTIIKEYPKDVLDKETRNLILEPLVRVVLDQEEPLIDMIAMLKDLPQDKIITKMITELNILKLLYDGDLAEIEEKIANNTGDFVLTQDMLIDITIEVERIRGDIVDF